MALIKRPKKKLRPEEFHSPRDYARTEDERRGSYGQHQGGLKETPGVAGWVQSLIRRFNIDHLWSIAMLFNPHEKLKREEDGVDKLVAEILVRMQRIAKMRKTPPRSMMVMNDDRFKGALGTGADVKNLSNAPSAATLLSLEMQSISNLAIGSNAFALQQAYLNGQAANQQQQPGQAQDLARKWSQNVHQAEAVVENAAHQPKIALVGGR